MYNNGFDQTVQIPKLIIAIVLRSRLALQNRTVSLLISGHIHDKKIQCKLTFGLSFSSKYKAVIQVGTLCCSHSLVSVVLTIEGWGVNHHNLNANLSNVSCSCITRKFVMRFVFCQKTGDSSGSNSSPTPQRDFARDNTGEATFPHPLAPLTCLIVSNKPAAKQREQQQ